MAARVFTQEQLQRAFQARRSEHWPADFGTAMNDRFYCGLIKVEARRQTMRDVARAKAPIQRFGKQPTYSSNTQASQPLDGKRRAAGERDDD